MHRGGLGPSVFYKKGGQQAAVSTAMVDADVQVDSVSALGYHCDSFKTQVSRFRVQGSAFRVQRSRKDFNPLTQNGETLNQYRFNLSTCNVELRNLGYQ
jgi:hypothetical protein